MGTIVMLRALYLLPRPYQWDFSWWEAMCSLSLGCAARPPFLSLCLDPFGCKDLKTLKFPLGKWGYIYIFFIVIFLERKRNGERRETDRQTGRQTQTHQFVPLLYTFIGSFLYVPWPGMGPPTLAYGDDALTTWATWPGLHWHSWISDLKLFNQSQVHFLVRLSRVLTLPSGRSLLERWNAADGQPALHSLPSAAQRVPTAWSLKQKVWGWLRVGLIQWSATPKLVT